MARRSSVAVAVIGLLFHCEYVFAQGGNGGAGSGGRVLGGKISSGGIGGDDGQAGGAGTVVPFGMFSETGGGGGGGGGAGGAAGGLGSPGTSDGQVPPQAVGGSGGNGGTGGSNGQTVTQTINSAAIAGGNGQAGAAGGDGDATGINSPDGGGGGGGGSGGHALVLTGAAASSNSANLTGGSGGTGGNGGGTPHGTAGNGGDGGDGGHGVKLSGIGSFTNTGSISGGLGGTGGNAGATGFGGAGGAGGLGGVGIFAAGGNTIVNQGDISGGNGGVGGSHNAGPDGSNGSFGAGAAGIQGAGLKIVNNGTINGGLSGDGVTRADAIIFTGGTNFLSGTGTVGSFTMTAGGTFAPGSGTAGSSMTVSGNLAFASAAIYLVQVNPTTASFTSVSGSATLGGATVNAVFAKGSYITKTYTILTATGGMSGAFASPVVNTNLPTYFKTDLSYDPTHVYLNLQLTFAAPPQTGLSGNQQNVGNALINSFNTNGGIPLVYGGLNAAGLSQASGEPATGSQQTTFNAMGQFLGLLTDPFMDRGPGADPNIPAPGFVDEAALGYAAKEKRLVAEREAYAMFTKAPLRETYEPRWSVWASAYGGAQSTDGNAATGSNSATSRIFGTAVGVDYLLSSRTIAGFALAGGGTNFGVNGQGYGRSDLFQAGAYVRHSNGPAYISAAFAYGWQDVTTDRTVTIAGMDRLHAEFNANAWSGRLESGYRLVAPWLGGIGLTPYAAGQFTTFDLPPYAEQVLAGTGAFALAYGAKSVTDTRSELGLRSDKSLAVSNAILTLRGRLAWAHDFNPDRAIAATFQALPGASFVVNGAAQATNSALTTASAEMKWLNGWSAAATFEGEFSGVTRAYAGKAVLRFAW